MDWTTIGAAIVGLIGGSWGEYQRRKRRAAEMEMARTQRELEAISAEANRLRGLDDQAELAKK